MLPSLVAREAQDKLVDFLDTSCDLTDGDDAPDGTPAPPEGRTVELVALRYTDPGLEPRMERTYPTPWTRCDREEDYRTAWAEFERRLGDGKVG